MNDSWHCAWLVVAKADQLTDGADGKNNLRFVVTSLPITNVDARTKMYVARAARWRTR